MGKALVVYATRTGETKKIAELIAEGIRFAASDAVVSDVTAIKSEADLEGYDAYVFGSATYHGQMMKTMKTLLFLAEKIVPQGTDFTERVLVKKYQEFLGQESAVLKVYAGQPAGHLLLCGRIEPRSGQDPA